MEINRLLIPILIVGANTNLVFRKKEKFSCRMLVDLFIALQQSLIYLLVNNNLTSILQWLRFKPYGSHKLCNRKVIFHILNHFIPKKIYIYMYITHA